MGTIVDGSGADNITFKGIKCAVTVVSGKIKVSRLYNRYFSGTSSLSSYLAPVVSLLLRSGAPSGILWLFVPTLRRANLTRKSAP